MAGIVLGIITCLAIEGALVFATLLISAIISVSKDDDEDK